jgi:4-diphosphocytidyl-2-C-methyl-D-erythritol kinase
MTTIRAAAKVNLNLLVTDRREDGMHLIDSLAVFADLVDVLTIIPGDNDDFSITGPMATMLSCSEDNLVTRARDKYRDATGWNQPLRINLEKHIPIAAGIGGGSTDAATLLIAANNMAGGKLGADELVHLGLDLGTDIPVCLGASDATAWRICGIGEKTTPIDLPLEPGLVLINSGIAVTTADVFRTMAANSEGFDVSPEYPATIDMAGFRDLLEKGNSLYSAARHVCPQIETAARLTRNLAEKSKAIHHGMSGSGATFFAIFETVAAARQAISDNTPPCWHWAGGLFQSDQF